MRPLSRDHARRTEKDPGDTDRGTDLAPGASYTASKTVNVSGIAAGTYYVVVAADRGNAVYEASEESDNTLATTAITLP